jgi:5-deoxy-glucuronate isomerase
MGLTPHVRRGHTAGDGFALRIDPDSAGWRFSGLRVMELAPGAVRRLDTGPDELIVLPLAGACQVRCDGELLTLEGRAGVFDAVSDFAYVPRDTEMEISSAAGGRFALPSARARRRLAPRRVAAEDVPVELRGAGAASRQVNNFCAPDACEADRLIAVEVLTPGGNCSSYPPHKHDAAQPGGEVELEEIYYFEVADGPGGEGCALQRVYGSAPERAIDVCAEVRTGDAVLLPHGFHGPSVALPGYDLYYLNVMAGPGDERAWRFTDDPEHAWIRDSWAGEELDPRLPLTRPSSRT